jgi:hypothetical protein
MKRHMVIPDAQVRPGVDTTHIDWAGQAIVEYKPDVIVVMGDWWDFPSLSTHSAPGSKETEGVKVKADIDAGNEAFERLVKPMQTAMKRSKKWKPECHFLFGNHEDRLTRYVSRDPKLDGMLTLDQCKTPGFKRHPFLKIVNLDGIAYCHYFAQPFSGKAIGGTIVSRLNNIGKSFTQGHQQGFLYASKQYPDHVKHGLVAGRFYQHHEGYRPQDVQDSEWCGVVIKNEVRDGTYDLMPLSISYLRRKYSKRKAA